MINEHDEYNYSISALKILMSFIVVCCHFYYGDAKFFIVNLLISGLCNTAVPLFIMCSFYTSAYKICRWDSSKMVKRAMNLWFPNIICGILYFFLLNILYTITNHDLIQIQSLIIQVCTGCSKDLCSQMWFNTDLLILTLLIWLICRFYILRRKKVLPSNSPIVTFILIITLFFAFVLQYTGINYALFANSSFQTKYTLGRLVEILPYMCLGIIFPRYPQNHNSMQNILILSTSTLLLFIEKLLLVPISGFYYQGLTVFAKVLLIWSFASLIPFYRMKQKGKQILRYIANLTPTIYYVHMLIGLILNRIFELYGLSTSYLYIIVFLISIALGIVLKKALFPFSAK